MCSAYPPWEYRRDVMNGNLQKMGRSLDDTDMERALRAPPDVVRSALAPPQRYVDSIDQLLAAPQKILIPERYIPEKVKFFCITLYCT